MKTRIPPVLIIFALVCFALVQNTHAVNPPPDGGYPGFNTAEGQNTLFSLTSGSANTAVGWFSLFSDTTGSFNTATGAGSLLFNTGDQNTAFGAAALLFNTTGSDNTAIGAAALLNNTEGINNTATGDSALTNNTEGNANTANGVQALFHNVDGFNNTAIGFGALFSNTNQDGNTAIGSGALAISNAGSNTGVGVAALQNCTTGSNNTALGRLAGSNVTTASNAICIGANVTGEDVSNTCFIGNIRNVTTQNGDAISVVIDSDGQLGTMSSSQRFKKEIKPMGNASEAILALKPVSFQYKNDKANTAQFGLVAEDVAKVNPDLMVRDKEGKPYTVRYDQVNAMLLNEFLKEHSKNEERGTIITQQRKDFEAAIAQQQREIEALTATVKQQAAQIQKVSAQLEAGKPAPQVVNNP